MLLWRIAHRRPGLRGKPGFQLGQFLFDLQFCLCYKFAGWSEDLVIRCLRQEIRSCLKFKAMQEFIEPKLLQVGKIHRRSGRGKR